MPGQAGGSAAPAPLVSFGCGPAADTVHFGWGDKQEALVGRRRVDGGIEWVPAGQAQEDMERLSRWDSGKGGGGPSGSGGGDDEDPLVRLIKGALRKIGIDL